MKLVKYCDLNNGDLFTLNPGNKMITAGRAGFKVNDRRWFRVTNNGALQLTDAFGDNCEADNFRIYPYLTMPVYVKE